MQYNGDEFFDRPMRMFHQDFDPLPFCPTRMEDVGDRTAKDRSEAVRKYTLKLAQELEVKRKEATAYVCVCHAERSKAASRVPPCQDRRLAGRKPGSRHHAANRVSGTATAAAVPG